MEIECVNHHRWDARRSDLVAQREPVRTMEIVDTQRADSRNGRARWAAVGAAVAVSIGGGGLLTASASLGSGERTVFVPITPCRVMDTRSGSDNVGPRSGGIASADTYSVSVLGTNGNCTIPTDAVGLSMNVTAIDPSVSSYLTVFPSGAVRPLASNLNWVGGQAPVPNAVVTDIGADGKVSFFNNSGVVDVAADIVGYYVDHNHDDRYYTKAQVDAVAGAHPRTISMPAQALNHNGSPITDYALGLQWANSFSGGAYLAIAKPDDFAGTGTVTMRVMYFRLTSGTGTAVRFFARPGDYVIGENPMSGDGDSFIGSTDVNTPLNALRESVITWPAADETNPMWNITLQRDSGFAGAYTGDVVVTSVSVTYDATR
jgi:hypothetical protein